MKDGGYRRLEVEQEAEKEASEPQTLCICSVIISVLTYMNISVFDIYIALFSIDIFTMELSGGGFTHNWA